MMVKNEDIFFNKEKLEVMIRTIAQMDSSGEVG